MTDFDPPKRTAIRDVSGYCGFLVGFLLSAPYGWRRLAGDFLDGGYDSGVARFIATVFGSGIVTGIAGMGAGLLIGAIWEWNHRRRRRSRPF